MMFAHSENDKGEKHCLQKHLQRVADLAEEFADKFQAGPWGKLAGLLHDVGKIQPSFQEYLSVRSKGQPHIIVPHSPWAGALGYLLLKEKTTRWQEVILPVAGHHAGLDEPGNLSTKLLEYINKDPELLISLQKFIVGLLKDNFVSINLHQESLSDLKREFRLRMIFSALVDADYLDTENHFEPEKNVLRSEEPELKDLWLRFQAKYEGRFSNTHPSPVNQVRREVYEACLKAAAGPRGVFRLTVPTGGGKTLSGLAFALQHALQHGLSRIITAIPYTSIIDQTAKEYRDFLGEEAVLEHHSQVAMPERKDLAEGQDLLSVRLRLAAENWDFPVIVTTTVQLFESLFSNKPGRCRKLHNLAQSVILLDEVQTLPPEVLRPTLDVLRTLVEDYGVTVVLSTATQPMWENSPYLKEFHVQVPEIVLKYPSHFEALRRVDYETRPAPLSFAELAWEIREQTQVMVVLNTRKDALQLVRELKQSNDLYHLSTLLCGAHRQKILAEIKERLRSNQSVRLISTQVVEAGVDLDFPVVYRVIGPLDRIVQAAGRCNREGKLPARGKVVIVELAEGKVPGGPYQEGLRIAQVLLKLNPPKALHELGIYEDYFRRLFEELKGELDREGIQEFRKVLNYPLVAKKYKLIHQSTSPVVVPYQESNKLLEQWQAKPSREAWRRLQPYLVNLYDWEVEKFKEGGWVEEIMPGIFEWKGGKGSYDKRLGLVGAYYDPCYDPCDLVI